MTTKTTQTENKNSPSFSLFTGLSVVFTIIFYVLARKFGSPLAVMTSIVLFGQVHFVMAYAFTFRNVAKWLGRGTAFAVGFYTLLIGSTLFFYQPLFLFVSSFWGQMAILLYFLLHHYENILYFWESMEENKHQHLMGWERRFFYVLLAVTSFLLIFPKARIDSGLSPVHGYVYLLTCIFLGVAFLVFLCSSPTRLKKGAILLPLFFSVILFTLGLVVLSGFNFLHTALFIILWHFVVWHLFYVLKLWRRNPSFSFSFSSQHPSNDLYSRFLAYSVSGPVPFLVSTFVFAVPILGYFFMSYGGDVSQLLFNPFYGEYALFVWSVPHIILSFLPTPRT